MKSKKYFRSTVFQAGATKYPRWRHHRDAHSHLFWVRDNLWVVEVHEWPKGQFSVAGKFSVSGCGTPEKRFDNLEDALLYGEMRAYERQWAG
jgi:hypothetical protein